MTADREYTLDTARQFIGTELGVSAWLTIDQFRINAFAEVTEDRQWIHVDTDRARQSPWGAPIAHGLLLLGLTVKWAEESGALPGGASMCVNYGYDHIRFPAPVRAGQRVRCRTSLKAVEERGPGRYLITTQYTIEIEGESKPALVADCLGMFFR